MVSNLALQGKGVGHIISILHDNLFSRKKSDHPDGSWVKLIPKIQPSPRRLKHPLIYLLRNKLSNISFSEKRLSTQSHSNPHNRVIVHIESEDPILHMRVKSVAIHFRRSKLLQISHLWKWRHCPHLGKTLWWFVLPKKPSSAKCNVTCQTESENPVVHMQLETVGNHLPKKKIISHFLPLKWCIVHFHTSTWQTVTPRSCISSNWDAIFCIESEDPIRHMKHWIQRSELPHILP